MNVIHIITDTLKRDWLEPYDSDWVKTPNMQQFAQRSVVFEQAYCASFPCMPARRDFLTGRYEFPFRGWGPLEEDDITIPGLLKDEAVATGLVTDHYHLFRKGSGNYHFDFKAWQLIRGIEADRVYSESYKKHPIDFPCTPERLPEVLRQGYCLYKHFDIKEERDWFSPQTFNAAAEWVEHNQHEEQFFLQIDAFPPHEPFDPPPGYAEMYDPDYDGEKIIFPAYMPWEGNYTERELQHICALYAGMITHVDKWFGHFIDRLDELGVLDNTMVILSTDHGTYTGDHGWTGKLGTYLYDCVTHIPLIIYHPEISPRRETTVVSNADVAPTVLDTMGKIVPATMHGKSLLPLMNGSTTVIRKFAHSGLFGRQHIINNGRYALHLAHDQSKPLYWYGLTNSDFIEAGPLGPVENGRRKVNTANNDFTHPTSPALFDLANNPEQTVNLIDREPEIVNEFMIELQRFLKEIDAPAEYYQRLILPKVVL